VIKGLEVSGIDVGTTGERLSYGQNASDLAIHGKRQGACGIAHAPLYGVTAQLHVAPEQERRQYD
jgi:hypothetical protein